MVVLKAARALRAGVLPVVSAIAVARAEAAAPATDVVAPSLAFLSGGSLLVPSLLAAGVFAGATIMALRQMSAARDDSPTPPSSHGRSTSADRNKPRSDIGTVLLHWTVAVAMMASLLTGLRIAADAPHAVISRALSPILPQGEVWTVHFVSSLALFYATTAYILYIARGGLKRRISLKKLRVFMLPTAPRMRWGAANVALYWAFYVLLLVLTATGIALYWGFGDWVVQLHLICAFATIGYVAAHLITHFGYGGWQQIMRIFRPTRLIPNRATRARPLVIATVLAVPAAVGLASYDIMTRDVLTVVSVSQPPKLDGVMDDDAWKTARPVFIRTMQGANLGGRGESTVEVRAVRSGSKIFFAFRWDDPTRSLMRLPLQKHEDGWHMLGHGGDTADVVDFYEDKFAVLFAHNDDFGNGGSTHLGPKPLADKPAPFNERGYHYTTNGSTHDMWQWKASRGGMLGYVDDMFLGPPTTPTPDEAARLIRYQAGYWGDPGRAFYVYNFKLEPPGGYRGAVGVLRLPKDFAATTAAMKKFEFNGDSGNEEGARWWMMENESVPYSKEADAPIPVGTVIPGVLIMGDYEGDRADLRGGSAWKDGYWTLEVSRDLTTNSKYDVDFLAKEPLYFWVSVFDHTQTRHTRHMRPVKLELR